MFAGHDGTKRLNDLYVLNLETLEWTQPTVPEGAILPPPRAGHTADLVGRKIFLFGGGDGYVLNDLYVLEVDTFTWAKINCTAPGRCAHSSSLFKFFVNADTFKFQLMAKYLSTEGEMVHVALKTC